MLGVGNGEPCPTEERVSEVASEVGDVVLSERERRSLTEIELSLRAEDRRLTRSFELFRLDPLLEALDEKQRPVLRSVIRRSRWVLAVVAIVSIVPLWAGVLMASAPYAALAQIAVLPLSSLLLAAGMALHPDRSRRTSRRTAQRRARYSNGYGSRATSR
jgi:hypothetical protein